MPRSGTRERRMFGVMKTALNVSITLISIQPSQYSSALKFACAFDDKKSSALFFHSSNVEAVGYQYCLNDVIKNTNIPYIFLQLVSLAFIQHLKYLNL
jgi:hypothetical protein